MESFILARVAVHSLEIDEIPNFIYLKRLEPKELKFYRYRFWHLENLRHPNYGLRNPLKLFQVMGLFFKGEEKAKFLKTSGSAGGQKTLFNDL
jgi:hypothetical protein